MLTNIINNLSAQINALKEVEKQNKILELSYQELQQSYDKLQHAYNELNQSYESLQKDSNDKQAIKKLILEMLHSFNGHEFDDYIKQEMFPKQETSLNKKNSTDITKQYETLKKEYNELYSAHNAMDKQLQATTEANEYLTRELKSNYDLLKQFSSRGYFIDDFLFTQVINNLYTNNQPHSDNLAMQLINTAQRQDEFRSK